MTMFRVRLAHLLQRWRRALTRNTRRSVQPTASLPGDWSEGVYQPPRTGKLGFRMASARLHYRLYLPGDRAPGAALPLLVMLHGCNQDALAFAAGSRMNALADEYGCAVLYPEQGTASNAMRCWSWFSRDVQRGHGEAAHIVGLVREVQQRASIDAQRIYVAGMSAGAGMAEVLAVRWPQVFAACGLHSGVVYGAAGTAGEALGVLRNGAKSAPQETARALVAESGLGNLLVPAIVIHGGADDAVNPRNAEPIAALHLALAGLWGGSDAPPLATAEARFEAGGRSVLQRDYATGATLLVRSLLVDGLGHAWSGGDAQYAFNDAAGPDASRMVLEFLLRHRRQARAELPGLKIA